MEVRAGGRAIGRGRRDGAPGDAVARRLAPLEREGEAHAPRERRQHPVGEPEMRVGLGEDERDAAHHRGEPDGAGDVAAGAEHRRGALAAQQPQRPQHRADGPQRRAGGAQRVAAIQAAQRAERVQLVAGLRDERLLRPLAADEGDLGALSPQRVGDCQRRHDVPRRPAGCDQNPLGHAVILAERPVCAPGRPARR